jgi:hypothetical protein
LQELTMRINAMTRSPTTLRPVLARLDRWPTLASLAISLALLAAPVALTGCKQQVLCSALDSCSGSVVGDWRLAAGHPSCSEEVFALPPDPRLASADVPAARTPSPDPATFDWCNLLATSLGDPFVTSAPLFYTPGPNGYQGGAAGIQNNYVSGPVGAATIHYDMDGTYALSTTRTGTYEIDFPAACMREFGALDGNPIDTSTDPVTNMPVGPPGNVCQQLEFSLRKKNLKRYLNITCQLNPNDPPPSAGCNCQFDLSDTQLNSGTYQVSGSSVLHVPGDNFPQNATYCSQVDRLQLTGGDGAYLFDRVGLRTLDLVKFTPPAPTPDAGATD